MGNADNFSFLSKITTTEQTNLLVVGGLHVTWCMNDTKTVYFVSSSSYYHIIIIATNLCSKSVEMPSCKTYQFLHHVDI